ncbi:MULTISPECIES: MBL fold metallo-hydrolase [unclassified Streptomyces]|uniref:MBL fold metallo-hydrolase n=1 Tax=unclassified Streptomyces TaxID=2593676 RepID=UPI002DD94759|nr:MULTISPECIES: MBL fold metallo-hydrolase [unclassified Streptomyces]WSA90824.1 MBL fold metallo-hydrolase [Streptomyces sp. NBC_01795]WSB75146.1 MBL fold metallo-hydrolase [Streptomyces sp. NBC_01775]WSS16571.1 MBL fold metallo-hydrolase [Streptomyces sp. NBC_01186]WSS45388.1 MBL fold metallo-hydrolase [Streptomyces sp. NBC_01187]
MHQTWTVGDLLVHRIDEVALPAQTGPWLLPEATPDLVGRTPWLQPHFAAPDGVLRLASHSFAFTVNGLRVLVDTGIGNGKTRANPAWHDLDTAYLQRLTEAGFPPESVDLVLLTHLHTDHVGWNTRSEGSTDGADGPWVPTFPNARYLTSRAEWDHWASAELEEPRKQMFRDSVHPVRDAGLLDLVDVPDTGTEVAPGVRLLPTPGHTPGQVAVELSSAGRTAVITGDCVHHPVQLRHPDITSCVDTDPVRATRSRRELLARLAGTEALLLGSHFPPPTAGLVVPEGSDYRFEPVAGTPA